MSRPRYLLRHAISASNRRPRAGARLRQCLRLADGERSRERHRAERRQRRDQTAPAVRGDANHACIQRLPPYWRGGIVASGKARARATAGEIEMASAQRLRMVCQRSGSSGV